MSLSIGMHLGPYQIGAAIGAGGMGEVYRARDTRLGREVAIKVLPSIFMADPDRRARLDREARLLASLNHPHIAAIHGIEQVDGVQALVLELIEGETLRERLIRGALPLAEALRYATAIAEALEAAHEKGIIHRDLKPTNIKITPDGTVKVLDFGLAKVTSSDGSGTDLTQSPTITIGGTRAGVLLGTAAYMSPEQARGQAIDKRADIWAFGCVLYEMLTGRQTFDGETITDVLAKILEREPDLKHLPPTTPSKVRDLIRHCLQKDSRRRLHDIADARLELDDALSSPEAEKSPDIDGHKRRTQIAGWLTAGLVFAAIAAGAVAWVLRATTTAHVESVQFSIEPPPMPNPYSMTVSPDGRMIAFAAARLGAPTMLFVRPIGSLEMRSLRGTEGAVHPFWSPDSRFIGFATGSAPRQLKIIAATGGLPQVVCEVVRRFFGGTWSSDDVIVFSDGGSLHRVPAAGGVTTRLAELGRAAGEIAHVWPRFLPGGRRYLYFADNANSANRAIFSRSLDSDHSVRLMRSESMAAYAPPHFLLYVRQQKLLAHPFDASTLTLTGEPAALADGVLYTNMTGRAAFAASDTGTLVYRTGGTETGRRRLTWMDRSGATIGSVGDPISAAFISLSPDGKRVAYPEENGSSVADIWVLDLERNQKLALTRDPGIDHMPVWSPDGFRVGFDSNRGTNDREHALYETRADGATPERLLLPPEPGLSHGLLDWTAEYILYAKGKVGQDSSEIWAQRLSGDRKPFRYWGPPGIVNAVLSPDSRWIAYAIKQGGINQLFLQSFPDHTQFRRQISAGGDYPRWRRDGRGLFYLAANRQIVAVSVDTKGPFTVLNSTPLFTAPIPFDSANNPSVRPYDVTPDGQRFLFSVLPGLDALSTPITVVLNWTAALKK